MSSESSSSSSSSTLLDFPTQFNELKSLVHSLVSTISQQQDEISQLKKTVLRLEVDLNTLHEASPALFAVTLNREPKHSNSSSNYSRNDPNIYPLPHSNSNSPAASPSQVFNGDHHSPEALSRQHSTDSFARNIGDLSIGALKTAQDVVQTIHDFKLLVQSYDSSAPYLPVTDSDRARLERMSQWQSRKKDVEEVKSKMSEKYGIPDRYASTVITSSASTSSNSSPSSTGPIRQLNSRDTIIGISPKSTLMDSPKPHPLSASSSTPLMGVNEKASPKASTGSSSTNLTSSANSSAHSSNKSSPTTSSKPNFFPASTSSAEDLKQESAFELSLPAVELEYMSLIEATEGKPWPKVLNCNRPNVSQEETKMIEKFRLEMESMKVTLIKPEDLAFSSLLGRGSSANVYQGIFSDSNSESSESSVKEVAIKVLNSSPADVRSLIKAHKETVDELLVVQKVQSPHVVKLFGITIEPSICIVLEFCQRGSLYDVLCSDMKLGWIQTFSWLKQISQGVLALHSSEPPILHRDLKSLNFLVDEHWNIKVADFGLSRFAEGTAQQLSTLNKLRGTYVYCAPEIYFGDQFSPLSDVYSMAIIFWELIVKCVTGQYQRPFSSDHPSATFGFQVVIMAARKGIRPTIPACPRMIQEMLMMMWSANVKSRPNCSTLIMMIEKLQEEYSKNSSEWDEGKNFSPQVKDIQPPPPEHALPVSKSMSFSSSSGGTGLPNSISPPPPSFSTSGAGMAPNQFGSNDGSLSSISFGTSSLTSYGAKRSPSGSAVGAISDLTLGKKSKSDHSTSNKSFRALGQLTKGILSSTGKDKDDYTKDDWFGASGSGGSKKDDSSSKKEKDDYWKKDKDKKDKRRKSMPRPKGQFDDLLHDSRLFKQFEIHLTRERSVEYLFFFKEVSELERKSNSDPDFIPTAKRISETLLLDVCGQDKVIEHINKEIAGGSPPSTLFNEMKAEVESILKTKFVDFQQCTL